MVQQHPRAQVELELILRGPALVQGLHLSGGEHLHEVSVVVPEELLLLQQALGLFLQLSRLPPAPCACDPRLSAGTY